MSRKVCGYCGTFFWTSGTICDLCVDEGISHEDHVALDDYTPTVRCGGFPVNPTNSSRTIASCTSLDHAPIGSERDAYFNFRRDLARKYDRVNKGYADMSDFEDRCPFDPKDPDGSNEASDRVIYNIINRCAEIRKNNERPS